MILPTKQQARVIIQEKRADLERAMENGDTRRAHDIRNNITIALMQLELIQEQARDGRPFSRIENDIEEGAVVS